jgi:CRISPR-associated protein Cas6
LIVADQQEIAGDPRRKLQMDGYTILISEVVDLMMVQPNKDDPRRMGSMAVIDLSFGVIGESVAADSSYLLFSALCERFPWLHDDKAIAIHPLNGRLTRTRRLVIDKRSRLTFRIPHDRVVDLLPLAGTSLRIGFHSVRIGIPEPRLLTPAARLFSPRVVISGFEETEGFLEAARRQIGELGLRGEPLLVPNPFASRNAGQTSGSRSPFLRRTLSIQGAEVVGFALRVENLTAEESILLQEKGLGGKHHFGCGIFTPEKR